MFRPGLPCCRHSCNGLKDGCAVLAKLKALSCRPVPAAEAVEYPAHMVFDQMVHGLLADAVAGAADDEVSSMSPLKHHDSTAGQGSS